jgi:hypothetical protein
VQNLSGFYKNIGNDLCESVATATDTYGFNSVTSQFELCTDTNCQKCAANKNTCTQCKTVSGFYMNIGTSLCETVPQLLTPTDSIVTSQFELCTDTNCQKCAANKNTCTQCKTVSGFYMNIGNNLCESVATATDTYGFNSVTSQFELCTDTNCQKCAANKNTCTQCKTVSGFYKNIGNNLCESVATATDTYGFNSVSSQFELCTDTNCQKCAANKNTCTQCKTVSGFYMNIGTSVCETVPTVTDTYGFNSVTSQFEPCTDTNCQKCAANKNICTQCKTVSGFYMNIGNNLCQSLLTVSDSYGFNSLTNQFESCTLIGCQKCAADKTVCTQQCDVGNGFYFNIGTSVCETVPTVTDTYGFNSVTTQFEPCTDSNCQKCAANKNTCTQCKTVSGFYKNIGNNLCESVATATDTYGFNSVTSQFELCTDTNCQKCAANKNTCTQCKTVSGFYMNIGTSVCETVPTVTDTYGFNSVTSQFELCTDTNCLKCAANKNTCTQCKTVSGFYKNIGNNLCESVATATDTYGFNSITSQFEPCTDTNCQKCAANKNTCTQCKTISGFYKNIGNNLCESVATATDTYGFNSVTSQFELCTDTNCQKCAANKNTCTQCKTVSGFYMNIGTSVCETVPTVTDTYGFNSVTSQFETCTDPNCQKCAANKNICTQCKVLAGVYINIGNNRCETVPTATDTYGFNSVSSQFEPCTDTNCQKCAANKDTCTQCKITSGWYWNGAISQCESVATATDTYGLNSVTNQFQSCVDVNCQKCAADFNQCSICINGFRVFSITKKCMTLQDAPDGYGAKDGDPAFSVCSDNHCLKCKEDYSICTDCQSGYQISLIGSSCVPSVPKDPIICRDRNCLKCASDYKICTECDQANGYVLVNGTCHKLTIITTAVKPTKADVDLSWKQQIADTPIQVNTSKVYKTLIANKVKYKLTATDNSDLGSYSFTIENYDQHVILDFTMPKGLPKEQYNVTLVGFTFNMTEENGTNYQIQVMNGSTVYYQKKSESVLQAALLSIMTLTMAAPDSATGLALMGTLLAADPTGTFFRFTKILQIVNKLYFININYGKRLEAFLAKSALPDKVIDKEQENQLVYNSRNNRAKLSKEKVTLSGISMPLMMYKIIFYVLSWLLRGVKRLLIDNCIMGKVGIYFCHYANKVHLIIFNLVFIDFIWLAPRTLMHSRGLSDIVQQSTIFVMCLIAADLCLLLAHLLDDRIWRKALEHYTSLQEFVPAPDPSSKEKKNDSSMNALKKPDQPSEQDGPNQPQTKQINYKRTYFEIDFNVHLMDMATNTLSMTKDVVDSMIVRLLVAQHWLLVPSLQLTILSTQYANCFGITIMLAIELSKLFATIYAYLKYKYLKNIICLLMEVSQAICLILFFFAALLISPKRFDEIILDFYQDAGIWIVIASCVAEYLLLLTYIGVAAYDFFKNRKMMKKMNVQRRTYAFLKFDESHRDVGNRLQTTNEPTRLPRRTPLKKINVAMKSKNSLATNNPQLPKFDGETKQPRLYRENRINGPAVKRLNLNDNNKRWMNKSLKRKQIE